MKEQEPLKLYVNKNLIAPDMSFMPLLYPFWGLGTDKENILYLTSVLDKHGFDKHRFTLVETPQEAEYVLMPHEYWRFKARHPELLKKVVAEAQKYKKPLLVDASGDVAGDVSLSRDATRVLRVNQFRFELPPHEIKIPFQCEDLLEEYCAGTLELRHKSDIFSIGFVGWASVPLKQRLRSLVKELPVRLRAIIDPQYAAKIKGIFWRERAVKIFKSSTRLTADFIIRSSYSGNRATLQGDQKKNRQEFVANMLRNDYALVIRGDANDSIRFYEALSMGRIPVLIDTAVVLPLEHLINYREFCVIIDHRDLKRAPDILADFHAALTPEQFIDMQKKGRYAFETFLRYDSFSKYLIGLLREPPPPQ